MNQNKNLSVHILRSKIKILYIGTLDPDSKFYEEDFSHFTRVLSRRTKKELEQQYANMKALTGNDKLFNNTVNKEMNKMEKAGMFNINNMKPKNSLD